MNVLDDSELLKLVEVSIDRRDVDIERRTT